MTSSTIDRNSNAYGEEKKGGDMVEKSDEWHLVGGETFIHSSYFESESGDIDVDSGWSDLSDDRELTAIVDALSVVTREGAQSADGRAAISAISKAIRVHDSSSQDSSGREGYIEIPPT